MKSTEERIEMLEQLMTLTVQAVSAIHAQVQAARASASPSKENVASALEAEKTLGEMRSLLESFPLGRPRRG